MGKKIYTTKQFIDAIKNSGGIISAIAQAVGCDWHTAKKYIVTYPSVTVAYQDECEKVSDICESEIIKSIKVGNTQDAKWYLSKKRRGQFGDSLNLSLDGMSDDELAKRIQPYLTRLGIRLEPPNKAGVDDTADKQDK